MMPAISSGARMHGLVYYLSGPGKANEHSNPHVVAASSRDVFRAGGAGETMTRHDAQQLADAVDEARVVFGTEVTRRDRKRLAAAQERGVRGRAAIAEATRDENVWHCSLSLPPEAAALDDATWSAIVHDFMTGMGFDSDTEAPSRWVAIRHGLTKNGGDHVHIAASRVRDDGSVVALWRPHPTRRGNEGDYARAQRVSRDLEARWGLEVLASAQRDMASRGRSHAQDAASTPGRDAAGRPRAPRADEAPSVTLARRVRTAAAAAESEAEFVRLLRADGLVVRSARYDRGDPDAVTGFSVGLPAAEYSNRHGQPIMHGGRRLGEDLSLPRLRERWLDDDAARADARGAWDHADAQFPRRPGAHGRAAGGDTPDRDRARESGTGTGSAPTAEQDSAQARRDLGARASQRLREILVPLADAAATEADYARALRDHPDVVARPRYARGSTTEVVGYVVALHPRLLATPEGAPVWRNASYLGSGLSLGELRRRWPGSGAGGGHDRMAAAAWGRVTRRPSGPQQPAGGRVAPGADTAAEQARRWARTTAGIAPDSRAWHAAAADTAAIAGAAARGAGGADAQRGLRDLSDALGAAAGYRRRPARPGAHTFNPARRVAATMLAASRDDTTLLWLAVMQQVAAASRGVAAAMAAAGNDRQAAAIHTALDRTQAAFATAPRGGASAPRVSGPAAVRHSPTADTDRGHGR